MSLLDSGVTWIRQPPSDLRLTWYLSIAFRTCLYASNGSDSCAYITLLIGVWRAPKSGSRYSRRRLSPRLGFVAGCGTIGQISASLGISARLATFSNWAVRPSPRIGNQTTG